MVFRVLVGAVVATMVAFGAQASEVTIHGSTTVDANLFQPHKAKLEEMTGATLKVVANGSSRGIEGLESGAAQIGMISSDLEAVLRKLKMSDRVADFHAELVGEERIVFAVHPSNNVSALSRDQVIGILKGEITNWSEVGGDDKPIMVVTEYAGGGFRTTVEKKLLAKEPIGAPSLREMPNGSQVVKVGEQVPNCLVVVPSTMAAGGKLTKLTTEAEIVQPLNLVVKGERTEAYDKLVAAAKSVLAN